MQDKIHQPYRQHLVPGLEEILKLTCDQVDGLLGVCLSGAGPCILALCEHSFDQVGQLIVEVFARNVVEGQPIKSEYMVLDFDSEGLVVC